MLKDTGIPLRNFAKKRVCEGASVRNEETVEI